MPYRRRGSYGRRRGVRPVINSIKNQTVIATGTTGTLARFTVAKAVNTPVSTVDSDVSQGCLIKAVHISMNGCGLGGTGVQNNMHIYMIKNPGANLTPPAPNAWGTSNEKKFIFRSWMFMIMRNQDGNTPFHWEGWIPVPKIYQRMGTDDLLEIVVVNTASVTGHFSYESIYKWYR